MSKHTPGPWHWEYGPYEEDLAILKSSAREICYFGNRQEYAEHCGVEPNEADKALIAAAPDLLEALKAAEIKLCRLQILVFKNDKYGPYSSEDEMEKEYYWCNEIYQARAAIAKAEGKEEV